MIVDFHAGCGSDPRQGRKWRLADLAYWADLCGTDALLVESADARLCSHEGPHEELLAACRRTGGRFLPIATINLESDGYSLHVARTARQRGFAAVALQGPLFEESRILRTALNLLRAAPLPVYRTLPYGEMDLVARVAGDYPGLSFVLAPMGYQALELTHRVIDLPNVYLAMTRTLISIGQMEIACRRMGAQRILYAGDMPHAHPARMMGVIRDAEISAGERRMALGESARALLARHGVVVCAKERHAPVPRPPCPVIDMHGHIGSDFRRPDFDSSTEAVIRYLRRAGGTKIYVSDTDGIFSGDAVVANRRVAAAMRRYPGRIGGYILVNPHMGKACLDDIRRCRTLGFIGIKPYTTMIDQFTDPRMAPVWELTQRLGLAALCHCGHGQIRALAERYPRVLFLAAHMSFEFREKAALARDLDNVWLEISGAGWEGMADMRDAVAIAGPQKIVFGSDLNCHPLGLSLAPVLCSGLSTPVVRAILRDNALRLCARVGK